MRRIAALVVPVFVLALCSCSVARTGDDLARLMAKTGASRADVTNTLDDLARSRGVAAKDVADVLIVAPAPATTEPWKHLDWLSAQSQDVAKGVVCDTVKEMLLKGEVSGDKLYNSLVENFASQLGPSTKWTLVASNIEDDLSTGDASDPLWPRAALFQLQYC